MRFKLPGNSGLSVSELQLGTKTFGEAWDPGTSKEEGRKMFDAFAEACARARLAGLTSPIAVQAPYSPA